METLVEKILSCIGDVAFLLGMVVGGTIWLYGMLCVHSIRLGKILEELKKRGN